MNLDELEKLAAAATPGPWHAPGLFEIHSDDCRSIGDTNPNNNPREDQLTDSACDANAAYIAAMSPEVAAKLIAVVRAAKEADAALLNILPPAPFAALRAALTNLAGQPYTGGQG